MGNELVELLQKCELPERAIIMNNLGEIGTSKAVNVLLRVVKESESTLDEQLEAIDALGKTGSKKALKLLRKMARSNYILRQFEWKLWTKDHELLETLPDHLYEYDFPDALGHLRGALSILNKGRESNPVYQRLYAVISNMENSIDGMTSPKPPNHKTLWFSPRLNLDQHIFYEGGIDVTEQIAIINTSEDIDNIEAALKVLGLSRSAQAYIYLEEITRCEKIYNEDELETFDYLHGTAELGGWIELLYHDLPPFIKKERESAGFYGKKDIIKMIDDAKRALKETFRDYLMQVRADRGSGDPPEAIVNFYVEKN